VKQEKEKRGAGESEPRFSRAALRRIDAEIERDRKAGNLIKLGDTPAEAVAALQLLDRRK
jgi:hypothetical protein